MLEIRMKTISREMETRGMILLYFADFLPVAKIQYSLLEQSNP